MRKAILMDTDTDILRPKNYLSFEEYETIRRIKEESPKESFKHLESKIIKNSPRLRLFSHKKIQEMYTEYQNMFLFFRENPYEYFSSEHGIEELVKLAHSPSNYLHANAYPFSKERKYLKWSFEENQLLIKIINEATLPINFTLLPICFPGRNAQQIYAHYKDLLKKAEVKEVKHEFEYMPFDICMHRYFLPHTENIIANELIDLFTNGKQITQDIIISKAKFYYYLPWVLAERIAYQKFKEDGKEIYNHGEYTEDFLSFSSHIKDQLQLVLIDDEGDLDISIANTAIQKHKIPRPVFTKSWVSSFLKRNRLSWRKGHFARRGVIDQEYAKLYIIKLAQSIIKFGFTYVYNLDETSICVVNNSTRTVAPIGMDQIIINSTANIKECFTAIGLCSRIQTFPLVIITKGTTERCCQKFNIREPTQVWMSGNDKAWMNEDVMLRYLSYMYEKITLGQPCALVLDCFKAHCTKKVKKAAKLYSIELIFVPANGTSDYQPLDRRIFGVVKSKLRSLAGSRIFAGKDRYEMVCKDLIHSWNEITSDNLNSAWKLKNLDEIIEKITKGEIVDDDEDDWFPDEDDIFDWESDTDDDDFNGDF